MLPLRDKNPSLHPPVITIILIIINIIVFIIYNYSGRREEFIQEFALFPAQIKNFNGFSLDQLKQSFIPDLFTSMFMHGSWMHLIGNCWFLWIFGDNVEDVMGKLPYTLFYLTAGILAALAHTAVSHHPQVPIIGASGAIAGVMGAYLILYPKAKIYTFVPLLFVWIIPIPAFIFLLLWFGGQLLSGYMELTNTTGYSTIAFWAHIGGFVVGLLAGILFRGKVNRRYS